MPNVAELSGFIAGKLGVDLVAVELRERRKPGSDRDEPAWVTVVIASDLEDDVIQRAIDYAQMELSPASGYPIHLAWERKT